MYNMYNALYSILLFSTCVCMCIYVYLYIYIYIYIYTYVCFIIIHGCGILALTSAKVSAGSASISSLVGGANTIIIIITQMNNDNNNNDNKYKLHQIIIIIIRYRWLSRVAAVWNQHQLSMSVGTLAKTQRKLRQALHTNAWQRTIVWSRNLHEHAGVMSRRWDRVMPVSVKQTLILLAVNVGLLPSPFPPNVNVHGHGQCECNWSVK